jgi:hypothetical protein
MIVFSFVSDMALSESVHKLEFLGIAFSNDSFLEQQCSPSFQLVSFLLFRLTKSLVSPLQGRKATTRNHLVLQVLFSAKICLSSELFGEELLTLSFIVQIQRILTYFVYYQIPNYCVSNINYQQFILAKKKHV